MLLVVNTIDESLTGFESQVWIESFTFKLILSSRRFAFLARKNPFVLWYVSEKDARGFREKPREVFTRTGYTWSEIVCCLCPSFCTNPRWRPAKKRKFKSKKASPMWVLEKKSGLFFYLPRCLFLLLLLALFLKVLGPTSQVASEEK